jgi:PTH1 family peptidyl-tRNA hydrolase
VIRCVIGLGNPGPEYENTRHNIGFRVVDLLTNNTSAKWKKRWWHNYWLAQCETTNKFICCKPATYMNLSGKAVYKIVKNFGLNSTELLIVYDDVHLPLGKLRVRATGSSGGHNGLQSIINYLGTNEIPRLRIGIGEGSGNRIEHVLGNFENEETEAVERMTEKAIETINLLISNPWDKAIQQINTF